MLRGEKVRVGKALIATVVKTLKIEDSATVENLMRAVAAALSIEAEELGVNAKLDYLIQEVQIARLVGAKIIEAMITGRMNLSEDLAKQLGVELPPGFSSGIVVAR